MVIAAKPFRQKNLLTEAGMSITVSGRGALNIRAKMFKLLLFLVVEKRLGQMFLNVAHALGV